MTVVYDMPEACTADARFLAARNVCRLSFLNGRRQEAMPAMIVLLNVGNCNHETYA